MRHLTYTGRYAGTPFCGGERTEGSFHAFAGNGEKVIAKVRNQDGELCPACLKVYDEIIEESEGENE
jgi:hypothetical protein